MDDEKLQMMALTKPSAIELLMDTWDIMLAAHMIVLGYSDDASFNIEQGLSYPQGHACNEYSRTALSKIDKFIKLAERAFPAGKVKAVDTPVNWIKWAESKGYNTNRLNPEHNIQTLEFILSNYENRPDISPLPVPEILEAHKKNLLNWQSPYLTTDKAAKAEPLADAGASSQADIEPTSAKVAQDNETRNEIELTRWLRETWIKEGKLGGTAFFNMLKNYDKQKGSPITQHYGAGKDAGFDWQTSYGTSGSMKKKTVLTKVSIFKNTP